MAEHVWRCKDKGQSVVKPVLRTNNLVELSWAQAVLAEAGVDAFVFDAHNSIAEGSIGAIPRRLMVEDVDESRAEWILRTARAALDDQSDDA
jgi:hypothetical protein